MGLSDGPAERLALDRPRAVRRPLDGPRPGLYVFRSARAAGPASRGDGRIRRLWEPAREGRLAGHEVEVVLTAMRRRPEWYESYVERPLGREQAPVAALPERTGEMTW
jgi:hypothetical protein